MTHEEAKDYMIEKFLTIRNYSEVYDNLSDREMKRALREQPIDHFVTVTDTCMVGISLRFGTVFTFSKVDDTVICMADQPAFTRLAKFYASKEII